MKGENSKINKRPKKGLFAQNQQKKQHKLLTKMGCQNRQLKKCTGVILVCQFLKIKKFLVNNQQNRVRGTAVDSPQWVHILHSWPCTPAH
jgi:hypothetical protein